MTRSFVVWTLGIPVYAFCYVAHEILCTRFPLLCSIIYWCKVSLFRVASPTLWQSYDCLKASEATLNDMAKTWLTKQNITKRIWYNNYWHVLCMMSIPTVLPMPSWSEYIFVYTKPNKEAGHFSCFSETWLVKRNTKRTKCKCSGYHGKRYFAIV